MPSASVLQATKKTRALAWRALNASAPTTVARLVNEAFAAAKECGEPYHAAQAAAWPLKVLRIRGDRRALAVHTDEILAGLDDLNCVSRLWVLSSIIGATCGGPMNVFSKVVARFTAEARACRSWQTPRLIYSVIGVVDAVDSSAAQALLNLFVNPQSRVRVERELERQRALPVTAETNVWPILEPPRS